MSSESQYSEWNGFSPLDSENNLSELVSTVSTREQLLELDEFDEFDKIDYSDMDGFHRLLQKVDARIDSAVTRAEKEQYRTAILNKLRLRIKAAGSGTSP